MRREDAMTTSSQRVSFAVFGPCRPKERPRLGRGGRTYTPKRTLEYERAVRNVAAVHCGHWARDGLYRVTLDFVSPRQLRADVDNLAKSCLDGLQGTAFDNDKQVHELVARKVVQRGIERTEVLIERIGDQVVTTRRRKTP
jgi:crossover junction endodeoxyribonuclease RusA